MPGSAFTRAGASGSLDGDAALAIAIDADAVFQRANAAADQLAAASLKEEEEEEEEEEEASAAAAAAGAAEAGSEAAGWEMVCQHNSEYACWIVIGGRVLDATAYLGHHPGGSAVIRRLAGKDATRAYERARHSRAADLKLHDFDIGALGDTERLAKAMRAAREHRKRLEAAAAFLD